MTYQLTTRRIDPQWFSGHAVADKTVVPGAYYLLQAFDNVAGDSRQLEHIEFLLPLFQSALDDDAALELTAAADHSHYQVNYRAQTLATLQKAGKPHDAPAVQCWDLAPADITAAQAYAQLGQQGNQFSGHYQLLQNMCKDGQRAQFTLNSQAAQPLHILDACLHSVLLAVAEQPAQARVLMRIERCWLAGSLTSARLVQVEIVQQSARLLRAHVKATDAQGRLVFAASDIQFCQLTQSIQRRALVQGNFTLAPLEELDGYLRATLALPYEMTAESYLDWRHALSRPVADYAAYDQRVLVLRPQDLIRRQPLVGSTTLETSYLPNGLQVAQVNQYETDYLYREIFVDRCYGRHGITILDQDVVIDVGANIGMFSLYALQQAADVKVYAFEPSPRVAECLRANTAGRGDVSVICAGVASKSGEALFSFYPKTSVFSSFFSAAADDVKTVREVIRNQVRKMTQSDDDTLIDGLTESMMQDRLQKETLACPLLNLSEFIRDQGIRSIGLLKIDAEKAEMGILRSLSAADFAAIRQICLEVHDAEGTDLTEALAILHQHGFHVHCEEETALSNTGLYTVTATRSQQQTRQQVSYTHYGMQSDIPALRQALQHYNQQSQQPLQLILAPSADPTHQPLQAALAAALPSVTDDLPAVQLHRLTDPQISTAQWFSEALPDEAEIPYSTLWYGLLGRAVFRQLLALDKVPHKLIVVDADNTLWQGVVGEQGAQGIVLSAAHLQLQQFLLSQYQQGVLLAISSKNIEQDVLQVFAERPDMLLKPEHFVAIRANWQAKSDNIHQLATQLSLGLDSVIFIDDNPAELAEVTGTLPQVLVLQFSPETRQLATMMEHWAFTTGKLTAEDRQRTRLYQANQQRDAALSACQSYQEFLAALQLELTVEPLQAAQVARVAQLTERTNQFNATRQLFDQTALTALLQDPARHCLTLQLKDKYGDYGLVGAAFCTLQQGQLVLENLLLSCRALGKGVEHQFIAAIAQWALALQQADIVLQWRELPRNLPLRHFYAELAGCYPAQDTEQNELFCSTFSAQQLATHQYQPQTAPVVRAAANTASSAGLSLQAVDYCYQQVSQLTDLVAQVWPEHDVVGLQLTDADPLEIKVATIWSKVLGRPAQQLDDDFFQLGGNSLRLVRVLGLIHHEFGVRFSLSDAFTQKRTIRQQAAFIRAKLAINETSGLSVVSQHQTLPASQLSENQLGIYFAQMLNPKTCAYNVPLSFELPKTVSLAQITAAARQLGVRHPVLQQGYQQQGRLTRLTTLEHWLEVRHQQLPAAVVPGSLLKQLAAEPVRLQGPVLRLHVLESADSYLLLFVMHHIYCDLAGMEIVLHDFLQALRGDTLASIAAMPVVQEDCEQDAQAFWSAQLTGLQSLALPVQICTEHQQLQGNGISYRLDRQQTQQLTQQIAASGVSTFACLLGYYGRYLQSITQAHDFAIGIPVCLRTEQQAEQVGNFVNLLPIRIGQQHLGADWPKAVEHSLLNALEFKGYPYRRMVRDSEVRTDTGRAPLVQTTFACHEPQLIPATTAWFADGCTQSLALHGYQLQLHGQLQQCGQVDIALEMFRCDEHFYVNVKFDDHLLSADYAASFLQGFINFIFR